MYFKTAEIYTIYKYFFDKFWTTSPLSSMEKWHFQKFKLFYLKTAYNT